jgi:hypothetical protein
MVLAEQVKASPIFFVENSFLVTSPANLSRWFSRLWPRHAKQIRNIALGEWLPRFSRNNWDLQFQSDDFEKIGLLPKLDTLIVIISELRFLKVLVEESDSPFKWHDSFEPGPQMHLHILRAVGMPGFRSLTNLKHVNFVSPQHFRVPRKRFLRGCIHGGLLEAMVRREIMQPNHVEV